MKNTNIDIKGLETIETWLKTLPKDKLVEVYELLSQDEEYDELVIIGED